MQVKLCDKQFLVQKHDRKTCIDIIFWANSEKSEIKGETYDLFFRKIKAEKERLTNNSILSSAAFKFSLADNMCP